MDKLKMHSADKVNEHIEQVGKLFPNCVTEVKKDGVVQHAIDFDMLRQELSAVVVEGPAERYQFTWPEKRKSILAANAPIAKTLRPCREESVDFEKTENLYIEGDNLDALKLLQETYLGKVKMIYIDPPYNTGNDFVYEDDFAESAEDYMDRSGDYDEEGNRLFKNTDSNGRFHTDWLNMIYPRLKLAKDLLTDDGVIFISIDDNEVENLKKICNEVFGAGNFVATMVRKRRDSQANLSKNISPIHEYVLIYSKKNGEVLNKIQPRLNEQDYKNPDNDERGPYVTMPCTNKGGAIYSVLTPTGKILTDEWRFKKETYDKLVLENRIVFPRGGEGKPRYKLFLQEKMKDGVLANTWLDNISSNQEASREIKDIFNNLMFDTPKPVGLLKFCLQLSTKHSDVILDFFSGSATTAHAVMQLNAEDGGHRKFIMVQLPEETDEKSEAYKAGYKNICEIGKERIRRAGKKIKEEAGMTAPDLDIGFRVLKVDSTNMEDVYYNPAELQQNNLFSLADNIKPNRTAEDLLFQIMLDLGVLLSSKIETSEIAGKTLYSVEGGYLLACFDGGVTDEVVTAVAKKKPYYFVMRDSSLANDSLATNFEQIFATYSPTTVRKVL